MIGVVRALSVGAKRTLRQAGELHLLEVASGPFDTLSKT